MASVTFTGWGEGLNKVELNHLLRRECGLGLAEAKDLVDLLLEGEPFTVKVGSSESAERMVRDAASIHAVARVDG
jgi:ribosomal protein L7/L12